MNNYFIKKGKKPGKTVAVFGGVHGNEQVGVKMLDELRESLDVIAGEVYLVYANPQAIEKKVRCIDGNLNRCMMRDLEGENIEKNRALELMNILDKCDALLDLHSFTDPNGEAFAICEKNSFKIAEKFNVPVISSGWNDIEPGGTDGYMYENNKIGICLECGPHNQDKTIDVARQAIEVFLSHFGCIKSDIKLKRKSKRYIEACKVIFRRHDNFSFSKEYKNFDKLAAAKVFAKDGDIKYSAEEGDCIILPTPNEPIGGEVCVLGREDDID